MGPLRALRPTVPASRADGARAAHHPCIERHSAPVRALLRLRPQRRDVAASRLDREWTWSGYDGTHIRLKQSKTGARVTIPVGAPLKAALDAAQKHGPLILVNSLRRPWTSHGFQTSWRIAATKAGIVGITFHDLRGTAVTRLAVVGCTEAEIATITGHSLRDVRSILDANYLHRDAALGESAIRKLERGRTK
jgi:integrase